MPTPRTGRAVVAAVALLVGGASVAGLATPAAQAAAGSTLRFGHEVVIDHQRSGFEPDIVTDSKGRVFSSVPNGSSQGESFVWRSLDHGDSFQLVPGNVAFGKPASCVGGGDTELAKDTGDNLYLSDLQNLTNLSNSVTTDAGMTFSTSCTAAPNTPVDRMWFASHGKLGDPDFAIYEEYDAVLSGVNGGPTNQLVETVSHDGVNFLPVINANPNLACLGGGAVNCVTNEEGIPGNQVVNKLGELVIAHSSSDGNGALVSYGKPVTSNGITTATWKDVFVNRDICPDKTSSAPGICGAANFNTVAQDSAGNLYMVYASQLIKSGNAAGPYNVYLSVSHDGGHTWGRSIQVSKGGSNAFPWVTAGSAGRVAVAWYHANEEGEQGHYQFDDLAHAEFDVQVSQSVDALATAPHFATVTASEHPMKYGPICTAGTTCTVSMGDRSLGDYLNLGVDTDGALEVVYVDDTSNSFTTGPTGAIAENGPPVYQRQVGGTSMIAGKSPSHNAYPFDKVSDPVGDAHYSGNSLYTKAGDNLDVTGTAVTEDKNGLVITLTMKSLESLSIDTTFGPATAGVWLTRFTTYNGHTPGNGHIYYVGMESRLGGAPRFFLGDVASAPVQLSMVFDSATAANGSYSPRGTITWHVPYASFPGLKKKALMYSATGIAGTTLASAQANPAGIINLVDATAPFDHVAGGTGVPKTVRPTEPLPGKGPVTARPQKGPGLAATGGLGAPLAALLLLSTGLVLVRHRRRLG
ncbi:MAG: hypothetical protein JWO22_1525 [Frankiales bacterium]|nr:hypothetical protein [Frankiales bacterium]